MGYRSDVAIEIAFNNNKNIKKEDIDKRLKEFTDIIKPDKILKHKDYNSFILFYYDIKWYYEYVDVKEFMDLLKKYGEEIEEQNTPSNKENILMTGIKFIRTGEYYDDIEERYYGDVGDLGIIIRFDYNEEQYNYTYNV